jgi:hypothetical protein
MESTIYGAAAGCTWRCTPFIAAWVFWLVGRNWIDTANIRIANNNFGRENNLADQEIT